ncbi:unnamed protein product [Prorocentrum cordatum]|uniref:Uncharacterized protein n=1 Tax=Prorocentrum cordatum TaxID=2364126 RepID=A0ABN9T252_9DINO|nr:unnamed protein product [Polarella glacialis]
MATLALPDGMLNDWPDVLGYCELDPAVWAQIAQEMGDSTLQNLSIIATLQGADLAEAAQECKLKGIAKTKLNIAVNIARLKVGVATADIFSQVGVHAPARVASPVDARGAPAVAAPAPVVNVLKVKDYYDQASRLTVLPLEETRIAEMRKRLQATTVLSVPVRVWYTDDQVSVLGCLADACYPMLAFDMGVWGPQDGRRQRAAALSAHVQNSAGEWITKEIKGPPNLGAWIEAWDFASAGFLMGDVMDRAVAEGYRDFFTRMVRNYPGAETWAVCADAEWTFRFEFAADELERQRQFHGTSPDIALYEPARRWNSVLVAGVRGIDAMRFWEEHLKEPARRLLYSRANAGGSASWADARASVYHRVAGASPCAGAPAGGAGGPGPPLDSGAGGGRRSKKRAAEAARAATDGGQPTRTRLPQPLVRGRGRDGEAPDPNAKRADGRFYMDVNGLEWCYAWNRSATGCSDGAACRAAQKRVHACEWCRGTHRPPGGGSGPGDGVSELVRSAGTSWREPASQGPAPKRARVSCATEPGDLLRVEATAPSRSSDEAPRVGVASRPRCHARAFVDLFGRDSALTAAVKQYQALAFTETRLRRGPQEPGIPWALQRERLRWLANRLQGGKVTWLVADARECAQRLARHARMQLRAGGCFTLVFDRSSDLWALVCLQRLAQCRGVQRVGQVAGADEAGLGSVAWLTNAPWVTPSTIMAGPAGLAGAFVHFDLPPCIYRPVIITDEPRADAIDPALQRLVREQENQMAVGGMRNPHRSIHRVPGWTSVGNPLRRVLLDVCVRREASVRSTMQGAGAPGCAGFPTDVVEATRASIAAEFGVALSGVPRADRAAMFRALIAESGDPDDVLSAWVGGAAPLGIERPMPCRGIFPRVERCVPEPDNAGANLEVTDNFPNYLSVEADPHVAAEEIAKDISRGFLRWSTRRELLAALARVKNGRSKVRLIHDLQRSHVNALAAVPERVVLPRFLDAVRAMLASARGSPGRAPAARGDAEVAVVDFTDAFKQLGVDAAEQRPLVWGRVAAFLIRAAAAILRPLSAGVQCYGDDPIFALLDVPMCASSEVDWIGARLAYMHEAGRVVGVTVTISPDKVAKVGRALDELAADTFCDRKAVEEFAGLCSWVGSIVQTVRPFARMVWAAACAPPGGHETSGQVAKEFFVDDAGEGPTIVFDASFTGGEAFLEPSGASAANIRYFVAEWTPEDATALQARWLDPAAQPLWEAYALLIAVHAWHGRLGGQRGRLQLRGDAKGVLQAVVRKRAHHAALNRVAAELLLILGRAMHDIDALSRVHGGADVPQRLAHTGICDTPVRRRPWRILG